MNAGLLSDTDLPARLEDATLNAGAVTQQRWADGWLLRLNPGKAQRARSVQALRASHRPLDVQLAHAAACYRASGLPLLLRITPFSQPPDLDAALSARGYQRHDPSVVLARPLAPADFALALDAPPPPGLAWAASDGADFAHTIGWLRGTPATQVAAHAQRLQTSPVPYRGLMLQRGPAPPGVAPTQPAQVLAAAQLATEDTLAGLYDVHTATGSRGQGLARLLCERLLAQAASAGAQVAYLQVGIGNTAACRLYQRLGFTEVYRYHYRVAPDGAD